VLGPNKKFIVEPFAAVYVCGKRERKLWRDNKHAGNKIVCQLRKYDLLLLNPTVNLWIDMSGSLSEM